MFRSPSAAKSPRRCVNTNASTRCVPTLTCSRDGRHTAPAAGPAGRDRCRLSAISDPFRWWPHERGERGRVPGAVDRVRAGWCAIFAADLAARYGRDRVLSYDMGGTTAKISLIEDFTPRTAKVFEVDRRSRFKKGSGMPISIPVIEMIEIGAGGGSIARVDSLGQIRVGPHSSGSEPGPAAYDRGGTDPTVTDANLALGRLHADTFGAADIDLQPELALEAIAAAVGDRWDLTPTAAVGISEVVDENMTNAAGSMRWREAETSRVHELDDRFGRSAASCFSTDRQTRP